MFLASVHRSIHARQITVANNCCFSVSIHLFENLENQIQCRGRWHLETTCPNSSETISATCLNYMTLEIITYVGTSLHAEFKI